MAIPRLNFHRRSAETAALSKIGFPMLWSMTASATAPVTTSIVIATIPLPVILLLRASYGYSGLGAETATNSLVSLFNGDGGAACALLFCQNKNASNTAASVFGGIRDVCI